MHQKSFLQTWKPFLPQKAILMQKNSFNPAPSVLLEQITQSLLGCTRCRLSQHRTHIVIGEGDTQASLMIIGEGPGEQEDQQGRPFVGRAGQLLDRMIAAIGLNRSQIYIANIVKCRPPQNRNPEPDEIATCFPFLSKQIDAIQPRIILALGKFASQTLLQTDQRISELRGHFYPFRNARLMPTFHPAYLLRNPNSKREAWEDLKQVAQALDLETKSKNFRRS